MDDHAPRILGGEQKGRRLHVAAGKSTRPLKVMARRSLFDSLQSIVPGARVLDLFAGAGTIGFEAASRGACRVVLVESGRAALVALNASKRELSLSDSVSIVAQDAMDFVERKASLDPRSAAIDREFDLVYVGPPYPLFRGEERPRLLRVLASLPALLAPGGWIVIETPSAEAPPALSLAPTRSRDYGESTLHFYER